MASLLLGASPKHVTTVVFSDVDGTLVHHEDAPPPGKEVIHLPASSSGLCAHISLQTLTLVTSLKTRCRFALVSGMRTSTFLQRRSFLPTSDAYAVESGGRIFHSFSLTGELEEDVSWRQRHSAAPASEDALPPLERAGALWDALRVFHEAGFVCDTRGYSTAFRVRVAETESFRARKLLDCLPASLSWALNLGCIDVHPASSGKRAAAEHLSELYGVSLSSTFFLCDDDNDVELTQACGHAFVVGVNAPRLAAAIASAPHRYTVARSRGSQGTEEMLEALAIRLLSAAAS